MKDGDFLGDIGRLKQLLYTAKGKMFDYENNDFINKIKIVIDIDTDEVLLCFPNKIENICLFRITEGFDYPKDKDLISCEDLIDCIENNVWEVYDND
jgi:hypothetical protein